MTAEVALRAEAVSKVYRGGQGDGAVWALRDVTFAVRRGSALGVVGRNGSGKTTLLKVLARVTPPTAGRIEVHGRVAPLLEVATGLMQPELSGRANVYLLAELFGAPRSVAEANMQRILEFARLERLGDQPARTYSSGLYRRLALATVLNLDSDVLLVDEILRLADSSFHRQCVERIEEAASGGLTVVLASHDVDLVRRLCDDAVWLEGGAVVASGATAEVVAAYEAAARGASAIVVDNPKRRSFNEHAAVVGGAAFSMVGEPVDAITVADDVLISVEVEIVTPEADVRCVVVLVADEERTVRIVQPEPFSVERAGPYTASVHVPAGIVPTGEYTSRLGAWVVAGGRDSAIVKPRAFALAVRDPELDDADDERDDVPNVVEVDHLAWTVQRGGLRL